MAGSRVRETAGLSLLMSVPALVVSLVLGTPWWVALVVAAVTALSAGVAEYVGLRATAGPWSPERPGRVFQAGRDVRAAARLTGRVAAAGSGFTSAVVKAITGRADDGPPGLPHASAVRRAHSPDEFPGERRRGQPAEPSVRAYETVARNHLLWRLADAPEPFVALIQGEPGSGKTTLARQLAARLPPEGEDVHWVNLRGGAVSTRDALMHLVNRFGGTRHTLLFDAGEGHDAGLARLRATYAELLARKPVTLVLDDAGSAQDVLALVPANCRATALVTSRGDLAEVREERHAPAVRLGPLDEDTSLTLLPRSASLADTVRLARAAGGIPLTLRIAASIPGGRIPEGFSEDTEGIMRAAFDALPGEARRVLRALPLAGEASFGATAASVLGGISEQVAEQVLVSLADVGFLEHAHEGRYRMHTLVREFAGRRLDAEVPARDGGALQRRLVRAFADLAEQAIRRVDGRSSAPEGEREQEGGSHRFATADAAVSWFERERSFVTATLRGAGHADPGDVHRLLVALCEYCVLRGDLYRLSRVNELARELGRATMVNSALFHNAVAARQVGELARSETDLEAMVDTQREASDSDGEARALRNLGITYHHEGRLKAAEVVLRKAVRQQGPVHLRYYRAWSLHALAAVVRDRGRLDEAVDLLTEALDLHREADSPHGQAWALLHWGQVHLLRGELDEAEGKLRRSRELYREVHDERGESWAFTQLGRAMLLRGRPEDAVHALTQSLRWHQKNEDARGVAWTSYYIGLAHDASDDLRHAEEALATASTQFADLGDGFGLKRCRADIERVRSPRVRLRLMDDEVRVGSAAAIHVDLAVPRNHPWDSGAEQIVVVATVREGADVEPYMCPYRTGGAAPEPAAFAFTAHETGSHEVHFRIYHEEHGVLLQEVVTTLEVPPAAAPWRS